MCESASFKRGERYKVGSAAGVLSCPTSILSGNAKSTQVDHAPDGERNTMERICCWRVVAVQRTWNFFFQIVVLLFFLLRHRKWHGLLFWCGAVFSCGYQSILATLLCGPTNVNNCGSSLRQDPEGTRKCSSGSRTLTGDRRVRRWHTSGVSGSRCATKIRPRHVRGRQGDPLVSSDGGPGKVYADSVVLVFLKRHVALFVDARYAARAMTTWGSWTRSTWIARSGGSR